MTFLVIVPFLIFYLIGTKIFCPLHSHTLRVVGSELLWIWTLLQGRLCPSFIAEMVIRFPELTSHYINSTVSIASTAHFVMVFICSIYGSENICEVIIKRTVMATKLKTTKKEYFCPFIFQRLNRNASTHIIAISLARTAMRSVFSHQWHVSAQCPGSEQGYPAFFRARCLEESFLESKSARSNLLRSSPARDLSQENATVEELIC